MTTLTCENCEEVWEFEAGLVPPEGWEHYCVRPPALDVVAKDIQDWVPMVVRELKGRTGTERWMRNQSVTMRGARLALGPNEFTAFMKMVKEAQQAGTRVLDNVLDSVDQQAAQAAPRGK